MGFEIGRIDHDRLLVGGLHRQAGLDPGEDAHSAPAFPAILEGLRWTIFAGRITLSQPIAIDEDYAAENPAIINARAAMALGKEGGKPRLIAQGNPYATAAHTLKISESAFKARLASARRSLGARTIPETIQIAQGKGLI